MIYLNSFHSLPLRSFLSALLLVVFSNTTCPAADTSLESRQGYLQDSLLINRSLPGRYPMTTLQDKTWSDWQQRTGELPPDFSQMPSMPFLPDPLVLRLDDNTTRAVITPEDWELKRQRVRQQFQHWISGTVPPAPENLEATVLSDRMDGRVRAQMIELRFGPCQAGRMTFELLIPPGDAPRPVYMTQWNHRDWAQLAVRRGYIGCIYAGADMKDDSDSYQALYPDYDFSQLMRRAWGASRVVDYLYTRPEVNKRQIAITGHSRNGKQSLWAAAFDDRIGAVISSSCGTGGIMPWRYSDPQYVNETLDSLTSIANVWFHPRLRFFFGREDKLPIDQNELLSIIAPRPLLMTFSIMEHQSNVWAAEQCFHSVKTAYEFLGAPDSLGIFERDGEHAVAARDVERHIDFLDVQFERRDIPWENTLIFHWDFEKWKSNHPDVSSSATAISPVHLREKYADAQDFAPDKAAILKRLRWLTGDEPPGVKPVAPAETAKSRHDWKDLITGRPELKQAKEIYIGPYTAMGDHMAGTLYCPVNKDGTTRTKEGERLPVIIYLHQYAYAHGYAYGYNMNGGSGGARRVLQNMVDKGFAVLAIDMFGFGTRLEEAEYFYKRQPAWSKMGKMISDVSACVDAVETLDFIDKDRVFLLGDTIGGTVALLAGAVDPRIDGVAVVAAFSPWRASDSRYESIRVMSHQHGFIPRLGLFAEDPKTAPIDFGEIMACIAPRPLMVVAPLLDRHSNPSAVTSELNKVASIYAAFDSTDNLKIEKPQEINRLTPTMEDSMLEFLQNTK